MNCRRILALYAYHVETHCMPRVATIAHDEQRSGADQLSLLVVIDCMARIGEYGRASAAHLNECKAPPIEHDEVNFASAGAEVAGDKPQTRADEIPERYLLCVFA